MGNIHVAQQVNERLKDLQIIDFKDFMEGPNNAAGEWE